MTPETPGTAPASGTRSPVDSAVRSVASVVVPITDAEVALAFWRDTFGFETRADFALGPDFRWIEVAPPGATTTIGLASPRGGMWGAVGGDTNISLACDDVRAERDRLLRLGVDVDAELLEIPHAPAMFRFRDPFENIVQVVQTTPHHTAG